MQRGVINMKKRIVLIVVLTVILLLSQTIAATEKQFTLDNGNDLKTLDNETVVEGTTPSIDLVFDF